MKMEDIKKKIEKELADAVRESHFLDEMHDYLNATYYSGYAAGLKKALDLLCEERDGK